jgi:hypothetical protein
VDVESCRSCEHIFLRGRLRFDEERTPALAEYARLPRLVGRGYRGLDMLRSEMRQGYGGIIIRRR